MISELLSFEFEKSLLDSHVSTLASQLMALFQMVMELLGDGSLQGQALKFCSWVQIFSFSTSVFRWNWRDQPYISAGFSSPIIMVCVPFGTVNQNKMIIPKVALFQGNLSEQELSNWSRDQNKSNSLKFWKSLENKWVDKLSRLCHTEF